MGIFDMFKRKDDHEKNEADEILEMIFNDDEFDECADAGLIPDSNPGKDDDEENSESDDDNGPDTEPVKAWWWPF